MKLFLSSYRAGRHEKELLELLGGINAMGFVSNAKDYKSKDERAKSLKENFDYYRSIGLDPTEIDLRPFTHKKDVKKVLDKFEFVWLAGGNAFLLRKALRYSGIEEYLKRRVQNGSLVYGGESAGTIMASPTLKGSEDENTPDHEDDPNYNPAGYEEEILWDGLGLIDYVVVPHYKAPGIANSIDGYVDYLKMNNISYKAIGEEQAVLIDGEKTEFLK